MKNRFLLLLSCLLACFHSSYAQMQQEECALEISLLTCTPGSELYSSFGHSALRVQNRSTGEDIVFNYGTFDFEDPQFYQKFVRGQLLYFVSTSTLQEFLYEYQYFQRGVTEQTLNISCEQKEELRNLLFTNAQEANKYYHYNFTHDNCTSRLRDLLERVLGDTLSPRQLLKTDNETFRTLIHEYLEKGNQPWSQLGIDILLGSRLDKKINNQEAMFLPDYLMYALDRSSINGTPIVKSKTELLSYPLAEKHKSFLQPIYVFVALFIIVFTFSLTTLSTNSNRWWKIFDFSFFALLGLLGILLLFMWFGTNHPMCKDNFNLLWASPIHLLTAILVVKNPTWAKRYFFLLFFYTLAVIAAWYFVSQAMHPALIFVAGISLIRIYCLFKKK